MSHFVKLTLDGSWWGWCYVRKLVMQSDTILLHGTHIPISGGRLNIGGGGPIPWLKNAAFLQGYLLLEPLPDEVGEADRYPDSIPEHVRKAGPVAAAQFATRASYMRHVYKLDAVRRCVAEDLILERNAPFLRAPSFLPTTNELFEAWQAKRPEAARHALEDADRTVMASGLSGASAEARRRLRLEAHRKIDAASEQNNLTPALGLEPFVQIDVLHERVTFGRLKSVEYPQGAGVGPIKPKARDPEYVAAMEDALLPGKASLDTRLAMLRWQESFAAWEERSPCPAFAYKPWMAGIPSGMVLRPGLESLGSVLDLSFSGIYPLISTVARDFLAEQQVVLPSADECAAVCLQRLWRHNASEVKIPA